MLSKMIATEHNRNESTIVDVSNVDIMKYTDYFKKNIHLNKLKLHELKPILRHYNLRLTGKKEEIVGRLTTYFVNSKKAEYIQCCYRGYLVRKMCYFIKNKPCIDQCINPNDFYTLEPLEEIPKALLYIFKDGDFYYGCNIISIIYLLKNNPVLNPYTRTEFDELELKMIASIYILLKRFYGLPEDAPNLPYSYRRRKPISRYHNHMTIRNYQNDRREFRAFEGNIIPYLSTPEFQDAIVNAEQKINDLRELSHTERITQIFVRLDELGNYTNELWLSGLSRQDYLTLYRVLFNLWNYRSGLTLEVKRKICVLGDVFRNGFNSTRMNDVTIDVIREHCIRVCEYLVFCGLDNEYSKLGAFHFLSALTLVSIEARVAMPWLYESLI